MKILESRSFLKKKKKPELEDLFTKWDLGELLKRDGFGKTIF